MGWASRTEPKASVLEQLIHDLEVDRVLSDGQLERHYHLSPSELKGVGLTLIEAFLAPSHGSYRYRHVRFIASSPGLARLDAASLRHLAGVAEMRRVLEASTSSWTSAAEMRYRPHAPDALYHTPQGTVAIEYDAGSYSQRQILKKARLFKAYAGQIWGTATGQRVRHLEYLLRQVEARGVALHAPWD